MYNSNLYLSKMYLKETTQCLYVIAKRNIVYPMCKQTRAIECKIRKQSQFGIVYWTNLVFFTHGVRKMFVDCRNSKNRLRIQARLFFKVALLEL